MHCLLLRCLLPPVKETQRNPTLSEDSSGSHESKPSQLRSLSVWLWVKLTHHHPLRLFLSASLNQTLAHYCTVIHLSYLLFVEVEVSPSFHPRPRKPDLDEVHDPARTFRPMLTQSVFLTLILTHKQMCDIFMYVTNAASDVYFSNPHQPCCKWVIYLWISLKILKLNLQQSWCQSGTQTHTQRTFAVSVHEIHTFSFRFKHSKTDVRIHFGN